MTHTGSVAAATLPEAAATAGGPADAGKADKGPASAEGEGEAERWQEDIVEGECEEDRRRGGCINLASQQSLNTRLAVTRRHNVTRQRHKVCSRLWIRDVLPSAQGERPLHPLREKHKTPQGTTAISTGPQEIWLPATQNDQRRDDHTTITPRAASLGSNQKDNEQIQSTSPQKATTARLITKCEAATTSTKNTVPAIVVASVRRRSGPPGHILVHRHDSPALPFTARATLAARSDVVRRPGRVRVRTRR
jgi:hypothetical protein